MKLGKKKHNEWFKVNEDPRHKFTGTRNGYVLVYVDTLQLAY